MSEIRFQIFEGDRPFEHEADDGVVVRSDVASAVSRIRQIGRPGLTIRAVSVTVGPVIDPGAAREMTASPIEGYVFLELRSDGYQLDVYDNADDDRPAFALARRCDMEDLERSIATAHAEIGRIALNRRWASYELAVDRCCLGMTVDGDPALGPRP